MARWKIAAGWCAAIFFIVIGFLFANGWSLMEHVERWPELWKAHSMSAAATGTALNVGDPTLWPRWPLMFGLALGTTAVWLLVDAVWLAAKSPTTTDDGRGDSPASSTRWRMVWAAAAGSWYVFGTWSDELRTTMFAWPLLPLTAATAVAMGLPWALMMAAGWRRHGGPRWPPSRFASSAC